MSLSAVVRALVGSGATPDMILAVVEAHEAARDDALSLRRASDAERQRKARERRSNNVTSRDVTVTERDGSSLPSSNGFSPHPSSLTTSNPSPAAAAPREPIPTDDWPDPAKTALALAVTAGIASAQWQFLTSSELQKWRANGLSYLLDVVPTVTAVTGRGGSPPRSWSYFTEAITQAHANRLQALSIPEAQANDRRDSNFKSTAERNQDSTIAAFRRAFANSADGGEELGHAAGRR